MPQQEHRPLHPATLQVAVGRLAEDALELPDEVRTRQVGECGELRDVEGIGIPAIHVVARPQQPQVRLLMPRVHGIRVRSTFGEAARPTAHLAWSSTTEPGEGATTMLTRNNLSSIYVLDQDQALTFYTEVLGLEKTADMNFGTMRWLTVRVPGDAKEILLEKPGPPAHDEATAAQVRDLVTKGAGGGWLAFTTADVQGMFARIEAAGVEVTQEPMEQPYGTDFAIRDPFGNNIRIGSIKHWDQ
jgi:predicted enzyme related to lactoylglutathione lyase